MKRYIRQVAGTVVQQGDEIEIVDPGEPFPRRKVQPEFRDGALCLVPAERLLPYWYRVLKWASKTSIGGSVWLVQPRKMTRRIKTRAIAITPGESLPWLPPQPTIHTEMGVFR